MSTPAQEAFEEGFDALAEIHDPDRSWTFGDASFAGISSELRPDDPRMVGSSDSLFEMAVRTADLPSPAPRRGDELFHDGRYWRIARADASIVTGRTTFTVSPT